VKTDAAGGEKRTEPDRFTVRHAVKRLSGTCESPVIRGLEVVRLSASLGVRFAYTQVTPRSVMLPVPSP